MRILSLGAGVQSTTLALMAKHGDIAPPDCAIFADTGWEPRWVYEHLARLEALLPFPVLHVSRGNLRADTLAATSPGGERVAAIPWHMKKPDGSYSMGRRQCSYEYKIVPIQRGVRWLLGGKTKPGAATMLIGISRDEGHRAKPSRVRYIVNEFPLLDAFMSRADCLRWLLAHGYDEPPKSSCIGCPFHSDAEWRILKADPESWADAVAMDAAIRHQPKFRATQYAHRSCKPLPEVDLSTLEELGQMDLWGNECEGMCGV